jgi:hypothetical protein
MSPRQCCHSLWQHFAGRPCKREIPHVAQVSERKSGHSWEFGAEVVGESLNDLGAPTLLGFPVGDQVSEMPVERDHPGVDRYYGARAGGPDCSFCLGESLDVLHGDLHALIMTGGYYKVRPTCDMPR